MSSPDLSVLHRFKREVTNLGPAACLPRSLSDTWLHALIKSADALIAGEDPSADTALVLAAVFTILQGSHRSVQLTNTDEQTLLSVLNDFRIELALELVHRSTDVHYEAATLQTIFTGGTYPSGATSSHLANNILPPTWHRSLRDFKLQSPTATG